MGADQDNNKLLIEYYQAIYDFEEKYRNILYSNIKANEFKKCEGYLINLKEYDDLKQKIYYNNYKMNTNSIPQIKIKGQEKQFKIKEIKFRTSKYLTNMILNGNKYTIISKELCKVICDITQKDKPPVKYDIYISKLILHLDSDLTFSIIYNDNTLDKTTYKGESKLFYEEINTIYEDIEIYYNFEKEFINDLKKDKNQAVQKECFLIDKKWFDKWCSYSNYEIIKNNYFENGENDKKKIKDNLIYHLEKNNYKYGELNPIENKSFRNKEELESFLKNDSLVLINKNTSLSFLKNQTTFNPIKFQIYDNTIAIKDKISFSSLNNIISLNNNKHPIDNNISLNDSKQVFNNKIPLNNNTHDINKNMPLKNNNHVSNANLPSNNKTQVNNVSRPLDNNSLRSLDIKTHVSKSVMPLDIKTHRPLDINTQVGKTNMPLNNNNNQINKNNI